MEELKNYINTIQKEMEFTYQNIKDEGFFSQAVDLIWSAREKGNRIHFSGIGKPSYVAGYMASLFSSIGIPSYVLHGTEAVHGSCGQLEKGDVVICISNSGETVEMKATATAIRNNGAKVIAVTGNANSWLGTFADAHLLAKVHGEGGPLNRAPRASILAEIVVLQGLSICVQKKRNITPEEYVLRHPGGALGQLRDHEK